MNSVLKIDFRTKILMTVVIPCCLLLGNLPGKPAGGYAYLNSALCFSDYFP